MVGTKLVKVLSDRLNCGREHILSLEIFYSTLLEILDLLKITKRVWISNCFMGLLDSA